VSSTARGGVRRRRTDGREEEAAEERGQGNRRKPDKFDLGTDDEDEPGHDPAAASSNEPQLPFADENSEEEESEPDTVDYRDYDDDDYDSDRGSGCPPSRTRVSDWLTESPGNIADIHKGLEEAGVQETAMSLTSESDLAEDLKKTCLIIFPGSLQGRWHH
jgi:hypothetical protein